MAQKFPMFKDKPLVRSGNVLYYGDMADKFVIRMEIESTKKVGDLDVADKVTVQLMSTDQELSKRKRLIKSSKKDGLFAAIDIGEVWLKKALASNE